MKVPKPRTFLMESYAPGMDRLSVEVVGLRAVAAAATLRHEGRAIEYLRAIFVPGDEAVFHIFVADDVETVREAGERAAILFERVVESVAITPP